MGRHNEPETIIPSAKSCNRHQNNTSNVASNSCCSGNSCYCPRGCAAAYHQIKECSSVRQHSAAADIAGVAPDGDWGWVVLLASFVVNCIVDGYCYSFQLFFLELLAQFRDTRTRTIWVISLPPAVFLLSGSCIFCLSIAFCTPYKSYVAIVHVVCLIVLCIATLLRVLYRLCSTMQFGSNAAHIAVQWNNYGIHVI